MKKIANLQDLFLLSARRNRTSVTVFLVNGFQMRGVITGFDQFVILLQSDGRQRRQAADALQARDLNDRAHRGHRPQRRGGK